MTAPHADQLIEGYLARLAAAAADLPKAVRQELLDDVRAHITEARTRETEETDAAILNILDRLGEPATVVADTRERLGIQAPQQYRPGALEVLAVILVPFFWPVGVILLWMSPAWHWRDKLIGTLVPPGGYMGVAILGLVAVHGGSGGCIIATNPDGTVIQNTCQQMGPSWLQALIAVVLTIVIYALPLITAGYLAIRLRWGRQPQPGMASLRMEHS